MGPCFKLPSKGASLPSRKTKTMHRAETQRRQEKQNQIFVALACEKPFQTKDYKCTFGFSGKAG
jgi:hypothetical protein